MMWSSICQGKDTLYQYDMWGSVIRTMVSDGIRVLTVFRGPMSWSDITDYGDCKVYVNRLDDLLNNYKNIRVKVILYPNNRMRNFQSLSYRDAKHIFINHGESEKSSMYSNQAKAYDSVFVAGPIAFARYRDNLKYFDEKKFVCVGRPQLDFIKAYNFEIVDGKKTILYAPTWEGTHSEMSYSSVGKNAVEMVNQLLSDDSYFLIYKPHPNLGVTSTSHKKYHSEILKLISASDSAIHINDKVDITSIFSAVDFAVFDNSSVIIDYLHFDKPFCITNKFHIDNRSTLPPIAQLNEVLIEECELSKLANDLMFRKAHFDYDGCLNLKFRYLGDFCKGESTKFFVEKVQDSILEVVDTCDE